MVATIVSFMAVVNGKFPFFAGNPYFMKSIFGGVLGEYYHLKK